MKNKILNLSASGVRPGCVPCVPPYRGWDAADAPLRPGASLILGRSGRTGQTLSGLVTKSASQDRRDALGTHPIFQDPGRTQFGRLCPFRPRSLIRPRFVPYVRFGPGALIASCGSSEGVMIRYMASHSRSDQAAPAAKRKGPRERTGPKADWRHIGADVPPSMYDKLIAEATKQAVPYASVLRWALADYFAGSEGEGGE